MRTARAMATWMKVVGNKEGDGSKAMANKDGGQVDSDSKEDGKGDKDKGGGQATATVTKRVIVIVTRVAGNDGIVGNGNNNKDNADNVQ